MQKLKFITVNGICGLTVEWDYDVLEVYSHDWVNIYGSRIGSGSAQTPDGTFVDMSQFAAVIPLVTDE